MKETAIWECYECGQRLVGYVETGDYERICGGIGKRNDGLPCGSAMRLMFPCLSEKPEFDKAEQAKREVLLDAIVTARTMIHTSSKSAIEIGRDLTRRMTEIFKEKNERPPGNSPANGVGRKPQPNA